MQGRPSSSLRVPGSPGISAVACLVLACAWAAPALRGQERADDAPDGGDCVIRRTPLGWTTKTFDGIVLSAEDPRPSRPGLVQLDATSWIPVAMIRSAERYTRASAFITTFGILTGEAEAYDRYVALEARHSRVSRRPHAVLPPAGDGRAVPGTRPWAPGGPGGDPVVATGGPSGPEASPGRAVAVGTGQGGGRGADRAPAFSSADHAAILGMIRTVTGEGGAMREDEEDDVVDGFRKLTPAGDRGHWVQPAPTVTISG